MVAPHTPHLISPDNGRGAWGPGLVRRSWPPRRLSTLDAAPEFVIDDANGKHCRLIRGGMAVDRRLVGAAAWSISRLQRWGAADRHQIVRIV